MAKFYVWYIARFYILRERQWKTKYYTQRNDKTSGLKDAWLFKVRGWYIAT